MNTTVAWALAAFHLAAASPAIAGPERVGLFTSDGAPLPVLDSEADLVVTGDVVSARVVQSFKNDRGAPLSASYLFPLPHDAAVHAMVLEVAGRRTEASIAKKEEAQQTFAAAERQGKTAALLEEQRANVFTQDVANIPPGELVRVEIRYAATVPREDGVYRLHFPLLVPARYQNGAHGIAVPELAEPLPAKAARSGGYDVRVSLATGSPIRSVFSPTHPIEVGAPAPDRREVTLAGRDHSGDFILEYRLAGERVAAGMVLHEDPRGAYYSLLVEPPSTAVDQAVRAREVVFVLDASCSMAGAPLRASSRLVEQMLGDLRPADRYRMIVFGSRAAELHRGALPPTPEHLAQTRAALAGLKTRGGTEIELGIKAALAPPVDEDRLRLVVFLTDGFIGDEASVMATIRRHRRGARIFSFGVGASVNRWLLEEMAVAGQGVSRVVGLEDDPAAVAEDLAKRLATPLLSDAWIDWGQLAMTDATPAGVFDLFAGAPVRIFGRAPRGLRADQIGATLVATADGREVRIPIAARRLEGEQGAAAIPVLWARGQIAERMRALTDPARAHESATAERELLVQEITTLGLQYGLTTRWTSFVAVSEHAPQPVASTAPSLSFGGSSTPEPATWAALAALAVQAARVMRRRRA